jgi:L-ascorbate metabolism protein UlaG (beta-lactamase superfamily)
MKRSDVIVGRRQFLVIGAASGGAILASCARSQEPPSDVVVETKAGKVTLRPIKHASVMMLVGGKRWYVDPAQLPPGDYPKADVLFITHEHADHFDPKAIDMLRTPLTIVVANPRVAAQVRGAQTMKNGDSTAALGIKVEAVPAYNMVRTQFHPKGRDNGYIFNIGGKRIYFAGDTEGTPEMKALKGIDVAFLPINLPYTMPPSEAAEAAKAFKPKLLIPYHQGQANPQQVADALKGAGIAVKVMKLP